ncbi:mucin-2-like [Palaemon carinicauda]|uniref:mucin-2-like n=1 Tax=Palaemon carinicauda TaxID=392227 RepID=UPI0035B684DC
MATEIEFSPLDTEAQESNIHIFEDSVIQPVHTDKTPLFQNFAESQIIEQESLSTLFESTDNHPLDTEGQESSTHITEEEPIQANKENLFQSIDESRKTEHESFSTSIDSNDNVELPISDVAEVSDSQTITVPDASDSFQEVSVNQATEQISIADKSRSTKDDIISDNTVPFIEDTTIPSDDYEDDQNENQETKDKLSLVTQSTAAFTVSNAIKTTSQSTPRENRQSRQGRRERPSSRDQLIERLKKLRERRLSTTRPHLAAKTRAAPQSDNSNNTTPLRGQRLSERRKFDQRRDNFYNRFRNRVFTTRTPSGDRSVTQEEESPVTINRPTTKKPLSFRERLNRYRENNRFIPRNQRITTPRAAITQALTSQTSPITSLVTTPEESVTQDIESESETETSLTDDLPSVTTEPTSKTRVQEIMDKIAATISQKKESTTTEEDLLTLNEVTEKPLFTETFSLSTTTPEPFETTADIDFNTVLTVNTPEEEGKTTEVQTDLPESTITDDINTSEVPSLSLITSSVITDPPLIATPESTSPPLPSLQLSTAPELIIVSNFSEDTTESSQENFVSSSKTLSDSLRQGDTFATKKPPSTTDMVLELEQISTKSTSPFEIENATVTSLREPSPDSAGETSRSFRQEERTVDEASIQALIAKLIAQGIITEAKPDENLSFTTEKEDDETIPWQLDNSTTESTLLSDISDKDNDISTLPSESTNGLLEIHGSNTGFDFKDGIPTTLPSIVDIENVPLTFVPFIKRTTIDPISSSDKTMLLTTVKPVPTTTDTTEKINKDITGFNIGELSIPKSEPDVQRTGINAFNDFFGVPSDQIILEDSEPTRKQSANDIEVPITDSMDNLQILLRSFGSSSTRPELAAVNRVIGLSLFDAPSGSDTINTNLEEPELSNDYSYYDYDMEPAATEQVLFTTKLETFPFETHTPDYQELITESSANTQDITVSENLVPTDLNMDVESLSVSEPSAKVQSVAMEDLPSIIKSNPLATHEALKEKVHISNTTSVNDTKMERIHNEGILTGAVADEPSASSVSEDRKEIIGGNFNDSDVMVIIESADFNTMPNNTSSSQQLENDEATETTQVPLIDTTPFIVNIQDMIFSKKVSEIELLDESVPVTTLDAENPTSTFTEITTIEPLVVSASDFIQQNVMTEDKMPDDLPSSTSTQIIGQTENIPLPSETKDPSLLINRNAPLHSTEPQSEFHNGKAASPTSNSQLSPDARSKAIVRERPDLLLLLRERENTGSKQSDSQHLTAHRKTSVPLHRVRTVPETVTQSTTRGRISLSQLLSLKAASGATNSELTEDTNNSFKTFLIEVTTQQPFSSEKKFDGNSQPIREHNIEVIKGVEVNLESSRGQQTTKENIDLQDGGSVERTQKGSGVTEAVNKTPKAGNDKEKELALQRFLALNREMLKSLRNGRKTTPTGSVTKQPITTESTVQTATVSSSSLGTDFHGGIQKNQREPLGTNTQDKPTSFLRPVPQPRLFNITSIGSLLFTEKPAFGSNQPHAHHRKGPTQFLRPASPNNSSRIHVTPAGRFHHSEPTSRFLDSKLSLRNSSDNINRHFPQLPRPTQHDINDRVIRNETTSKSPSSFFTPTHEHFMSSATTSAPSVLPQHSVRDNPRDQDSNKSRAHRVSTFIPTSPRPSRGQFTTLASLIKLKDPATSQPDITTPSYDTETESDFITKSTEQNIENFPSTTILPYFAEDEEETTQLGPLESDPMTIPPDEFETTIMPKTEEEHSILSEPEWITALNSRETPTSEAQRNISPQNVVASVPNKQPEQNFQPSKFFSKTTTTARPPSTLNPNNSFRRKGIANSSGNPSLGFFQSSNNQGTNSGVAPTTQRSRFQWKPVTLSNLRDKFESFTTTESPFSFSTTDSQRESVTTWPSSDEFDFGSTTTIPVAGLRPLNLAPPTTRAPTPAVLLTTLPTVANEDNIFFTETVPPRVFENRQFEDQAVTDRVPVTTVPTVSITPKIILLALPVLNATGLQEITTLAPKAHNIDHSNQGERITPSQRLRHKAKTQSNDQRPAFENIQHSNLRETFLASLPAGTIPPKPAEPKNNIFHTTPQTFPRLQQSITGGVSIRAEKGIIPRHPVTSQREFQDESHQQVFSSDGFINTTPSPLFATTQGIDGTSVDNDPDNDHIPGEGGVDYPILDFIPETSFRCSKSVSKSGMMYADPETACQVYHVCNGIQKFSFLCPRGTIFHQETVVCQWWYTVDCVAQARKLAEIQALAES